MLVGSLFTGIGGLDLGLERAGMTVAWQAEIDPFCCQVLTKHWPAVPNLGDVTAIDWADVPPVDLLTGGYPCQPFSLAGVRKGENDERHLWPHVRDAIGVLGPRWVLLENVPGHLSLGFGTVLSDLAALGYHAEWDCLPAAAFGAPHRRDRLFIVAYPASAGRQETLPWGPPTALNQSHSDGQLWDVADTDCQTGTGSWASGETVLGQATIVQPGRCGGSERGHWAAEPRMGRVAYGVSNRLDRLRALGNAVVPQVAEHLGRMILAADQASHA